MPLSPKGKKMKKLIKKFEDAMSAAAFAEAGEFETAKEISKGRQKVLLTLTGRESDGKSFKYALNICKRIGAGLEILYISRSEQVIQLLKQIKNELKKEDIVYEIVEGSGCIRRAIINHTEKRGDIQFVIIDSSDSLDIECKKDDGTLSDAWEKLKCPLVLVSRAAMPSTA